jgi:hypothetical protein
MANQTEEALGWTAEGKKFAEANPVDIKAPEALSIKNVPAFDRPMSAGPKDKWTGRQDELGNREYKSRLDGSTYFIKPAMDQRTNYEKIQQDIIPAVTKYLENPTAPSKEQTIEFLKSAAGDAWETISIPGDLVSGDKSFGDVNLGQLFEIGGGMAGASTLGKVPGGNTSNTLRMFGGVGMEGTGTSKNFKKAKSLLEGSNLDTESLKGGAIDFNLNQKIWKETNWYVDPNDGQWRFYIDDSKSELKPFKEVFKINSEAGLTFKEMTEQTIPKENSKNVLLESFFNHKDLYIKYPELKKLNVKFFSDPEVKALGSADAEGKSISFNLSKYKNYEDLKSVVLHEIQHIVQKKEDFVPGSNPRTIPPELVKKQDTEVLQKAKPFVDLKDNLDIEFKVVERRLLEEAERQESNPLAGLTRKQELEIRKLKSVSPPSGPSWTSIAKDYGVKPGQIQKAWGRINLLDELKKSKKELNLKLTKVESQLYELMNERTNIEHEFYEGAGGEIESRLVQYMEDGTKKFPLGSRAEMLNKEGDKFQYRGKDGADPFVYKNKPRRNPEDSLFLDRLKGKVKRFLDISPRFEEEITPKISAPVVRNMVRFDKKALDIAAKQNDKSREILVDMPIEDFLQAAKKEVNQTKLDNTRDLVSKGKPFESIPSLSIKNSGDGTAKVTDHDGRHRAMALREQGETTIPVRLVSQAGDGPSIRWGQQNNPDSLDYVEMLPKKLIEEDGDAIVSMPEIAANIREPKQNFAQGGVVDDMNRQMEMFAVGGLSDDGMTRDPVSGNDIPPGSMAEEVRDDIPAQLSEGEYVVPADVVRFFGVKYFEDLRTEAKMGLSSMEANGRIGGEPVPSGGPMAGPTESALTPEEMAALAEMGMNVGGFVPQQPPPEAIGNPVQTMESRKDIKGYAPGGDVTSFNPSNYGLGFSVFGQPSGTEDATVPSTVSLYSPDGVMRSLTLPAEQAEYDRLIAEGWSTEMTAETSVGKDDSGPSDIFDDGPKAPPKTLEELQADLAKLNDPKSADTIILKILGGLGLNRLTNLFGQGDLI